MKIFEYRKNNNRYWDEAKLLWQAIKKTLLIAETLYLGYFILFIFDNITSHSVYTEDVLCAYKINKKLGDKQTILCNGWYVDQISMYYIQPIWYLGSKQEQISKKIQRVLTKRGL